MGSTQETLSASAFALAPIAMIVVAPTGEIVMANAATSRLLGYSAAQLAGMTAEQLLPWALRDRHHGHRRAFAAAPAPRTMGDGMNLEVLRADGTTLGVDIALSPLADGAVCVVISDATAHRHSARRLRQLANEDPLTGLLNRRGLHLELDGWLADRRRTDDRFALMIVDVDRFKCVNDTAGHLVGDDLLQAVADAMRARTRDTDVLARTGGDEFIVCLFGADAARAVVVADALRGSVAEIGVRPPDGGPTVSATISIGIACFPEDGADAATLATVADRRLYAAKAAGRNRVSTGA